MSSDESDDVPETFESAPGDPSSPVQEPEESVIDDKFVREDELHDLVFGNKERLIQRLKEDDGGDDKSSDADKSLLKRKAVWHDSDDEETKVAEGMQKSNVRRYLQDPERHYKEHLATKFQKVVGPSPKWAQLDRKEEDSDSDSEILQKVGHVLGESRGQLMKNTLDYHRRRDMNSLTRTEGPKITSVEFHPTACVGLVTGDSGIATLFSVEPKACDKLHSIWLKKYPILCAKLSKDGNEVILGSNKKYIHTFDMTTGQAHQVQLPKDQMTRASQFELSSDGELIAVAGRFGDIHILNGWSKEWIKTLRQQHPVSALTFSTVNPNHLYCHSVDNEVTAFDLRSDKVYHRFVDNGCITGRTISFSPNGQWLATGSGEGIVNIYNTGDVTQKKYPEPVKILSNLATPITASRWNPTSEILGFCSTDSVDGIKLAHFPSGTVFANFPVHTRSIGFPNCLAFSPGSRYLAVGAMVHRAPLFELRHYNYF